MPESDVDTLAAYLRQYRGQFTPEVLRQHLLAQGFDPQAVAAAAAIDQLERERAGLTPTEGSGAAVLGTGIPKTSHGRWSLKDLGGVILTLAGILMIGAMSRPAFPGFSMMLKNLRIGRDLQPVLAGPLTLLVLGVLLGFVLILFGSSPENEGVARLGLGILLGTLALAAVALLAVGGCFGLLNGMMTEGEQARLDAFGQTWTLTFLGLFLFALIGVVLLVWPSHPKRRGREKPPR